MKNLTAVLILLLLVVVGCNHDGGGGSSNTDELVPGAGSEDYTAHHYESDFKLWEREGSPYGDADKTERGDSNLCWAAVAANFRTPYLWEEKLTPSA